MSAQTLELDSVVWPGSYFESWRPQNVIEISWQEVEAWEWFKYHLELDDVIYSLTYDGINPDNLDVFRRQARKWAARESKIIV